MTYSTVDENPPTGQDAAQGGSMNNEAERIAIVLAGGSGLRLGADVPKAFVPLLGRPLLWRSVWALVKAAAPDRVVVVVPDGQVRSAQEALDDIDPRPRW